MTTPGTWLSYGRAQAGLSLREVRDVVGVSHVFIRELERDEKRPSREVLGKLCRVYKLDRATVFGMYRDAEIERARKRWAP